MKNKEKFIAALESGKYEKFQGNFVPAKLRGGVGSGYTLAKENCACALGVYLIEIKGIPAEELAQNRYSNKANQYYKDLEDDFGRATVGDIWRINDARDNSTPDMKPVDTTFGTVIEYLKGRRR